LGSSSRPCLVKTIRRTLIWHPEQIKVWCSKPRIAAVFSGTTFMRISSASHAVQCIARTPLPSAHPIVGNIEHFRRQRPEPNIQSTTRFFTSDFFGETPSQNYRERIRGCSIAQRVRASCNQCDRTKLESRSRAEGQQQYQKQCRDCHAPPICCPGASSAGREQDQRTTLGNGTAFSAVAPS
jgi:hypothetical protein